MLPPSTLFVLFSTALLMALSSQAFTSTQRIAAPARSIQGARYQPKSSSKGRSDLLLLASSGDGDDTTERAKGKILEDGNFYDDEVSTLLLLHYRR